MGARIVMQYAVLGAYDFINIVEAPSNEVIARIEAVDHAVNAMVARDFDRARIAAKAADAAVARGDDLPPLHGLPIGIKDLNETAGLAIKRSRIDELLLAEGLRWRTQETWFGERADPECSAKASEAPHEPSTDGTAAASEKPRLDPEFARKRGP